MRTWLAPAGLAALMIMAAEAARAQVVAPAAPSPPALRIAGEVNVSAALHDQVRLGDTLFIVARSPRAGGMPVAVLRLPVRSLPVRFTLDDSNALAPELTLSRYPAVTVEARISRSGDVIRQPGDLYARPLEANAGRGDLYLLVDQVLR